VATAKSNLSFSRPWECQNPRFSCKFGVCEYRDGNNNIMVTIYTDDTGTHAECPGASGAFDIPPGSACMTAISALGGLTPGTACIHDSAGDCLY
jgi:hypothetical protein